MDPTLAAQARAWLETDPDPATRAELEKLLAAGDEAALRDRFAGRLRFGTAGLRGTMRAGPNGMNRAVVLRAAAGLAAWLGQGRTVVIGYDARHHSAEFADLSARILRGNGVMVKVLPRPLPTPVLAFAIRHLGADAGVMVTASHNPAADNGYKVYGGDGAQIVPPADTEIEAAIEAVDPAARLPWFEPDPPLDERIVDAYVDAVTGLSLVPDRDVLIAYTPLHGVGGPVLTAALARAGFPPPAVVAEQAEPDPDFPTVAFPNPEEPGAMDLVLALGGQVGADVVIANDPDADRLAVAVGGRLLSGDEVGLLLASHLLEHRSGLVATTVVSGEGLRALAADRGVPYAETLTGFKWIVRAASREGGPLLFGYEEALGYAVAPDLVRDKDGISAALLIAELAAEEKAAGRTLLDRLDDLARAYGVYATGQVSVRVDALAQITAAMTRLRGEPPTAFAGRAVETVDDLLRPGGGLPATDALRYRLAGRARVVVRPSGTEPKLKAYLQVVVPVAGGDVAAASAAGAADLAELAQGVRTALGL